MNKPSAAKPSFSANTRKAAAQDRSMRAKIGRLETSKKRAKSEAPTQVGQRTYPSKFPAQHVKKPGIEAELKLAPKFEAPDYKGSEKLKDCVALVTGGDSGIGRAVAVLYAREGADVAIVYLGEHEDAAQTKRAVEAEGRRCITKSGDADASFSARTSALSGIFRNLRIFKMYTPTNEHTVRVQFLRNEKPRCGVALPVQV